MRRTYSQRTYSQSSVPKNTYSQSNSQVKGEGALAKMLGEALSTPAQSAYRLTHRFHAYPGRCHPHLPQTILGALARPGESVLDPFMGSGTTAEVCEALGRNWIGFELNPDYQALVAERVRQRGLQV